MRVLITGASGLIGKAVGAALGRSGDEAIALVRGRPGAGPQPSWDPETGRIDAAALEGFDAVVHLAGENVSGGRWTPERKRRIRESRVVGTRLLAEALAGLQRPPAVLACASAIGYYGDRGDDMVDEESAPGEGFLAEVCREWEAAAEPARARGIRVAHLRFGLVLSGRGGALGRMLPLFRLGLGGRLGSGRQWMSWIALDDLVEVVLRVLREEAFSGPINVVAPRPVRNAGFTAALARVLKRPAVFPVPALLLRLALGEMADELLLASTRVDPMRLRHAGHRFRFEDIEAALRNELETT